MNRLIAILVALLALACANVASAQTTLETFETFADGATQFTSGGVTFDIVTNAGLTVSIDARNPSTGWSGTANDNRYIDNAPAGSNYGGVHPDFSIKTHDGSRFTVGSFWLYPALFVNLASLGSGGTVTVTGKLSGSTVFTASASTGFNSNPAVSNGFSKIDLTTFGGSNNTGQVIDEIEIATAGNFQYLALDALTWTKAGGYTVGTAVTPNSTYGTLTCVLTSVSPGGSTTCTATPNSGYELDNIAGCGGTTKYVTSPPFATGAINANCTVTATFVTALSASTTKSDVSCNGGSNGVAAVTASNGISPYFYSWSPSGGTGSIATGLAAGTYTVTVTDNRNIQVQKQTTVNQPSALGLSPASIPDGLVNWPYSQVFSATGGTPGYTYAVTANPVPGLSITGNTLSGAPSAANNYNVGVTATDANNCPATKSYPMQVRATMGLLSVSDGAGFAAYGQPVDYTVSLSNTTAINVSGIAVTATLPAALGSASWQCLSNGSNGVVCNGASNSGALSDTAVTIPAGQTAKWNIHAMVLAAPAAGSVDVNVSASYATPATDSDTLVIFRDGFGGSGGN